MFLKTHRVRKDGKEHIYYSLCESVRVSRSRVTQRTVLHLGELNTTQVDRWERTIETVQENGQRQQLRLFTDRQGQAPAAEDERLSWRWDREALRLAALRDGAYLLRTNLKERTPEALWKMYVQLTEVESVFRAMKSQLAIRPIWHWVGPRVEAHVMVAFLGYCLWVCLKQKLKAVAPSLTPWQLLDQFGRIVQVDVWFKLRVGCAICLPRITQPEPAQAILL